MSQEEAISLLSQIGLESNGQAREDLLQILARNPALPEIVDAIVLATLDLRQAQIESFLDKRSYKFGEPRLLEQGGYPSKSC